jgi:hypothetical protein
MKRTLFFATLVAFLSIPAAQAQVSFGVKAGLNVATLQGNFDDADLSPRLGLNAGVFAEFPITPTVALRPELLYSMRGATAEEDGFTGTFAIDYLEIPLLAHLRFPAGAGLNIGVLAGPALGVKLSEGIRLSSSDGGISIDTDEFKPMDFGIVVGTTIGSGPFAVDLRWLQGIASALRDTDETARHGVFQATFSYQFGR